MPLKLFELASEAYLGVFKEPRGFIRLLQFILAIFAFATTTSHSSYSEFEIECGANNKITQKLPFYYPFRLTSSAKFEIPLCNTTVPKVETQPCCDFNNPAEFYVFVGVMAFLYSLAAIVLYVLFDETYRGNENIPTADFLVTVVFVLLWLISSSAWADGVSHLKEYSNPNELFEAGRIPECGKDGGFDCTVTKSGNFANLNISLIFGFLNTFVWAGSCWFLFKESRWFQRNADEMPPPNVATPQDQQHI